MQTVPTAGVSVLPQDPAVEAAGVDAQFGGDQEPEARRVQVGATTDDALLRKAAELPGDIGQHVDCWRASAMSVRVSRVCVGSRVKA